MPDVNDVEVLVGQVVPAIGSAVVAYGAGVLTRVEDESAKATVRLGQRLLARILHRAPNRASVEAAVTDLAAVPEDVDALGALRLQIRKVLAGDAELVAELSALMPARAQATGDHSTAVAGDVNISTSGPNAPAAYSIGQVRYTEGPTVPGQPQG
ncbi:hypothetical protein GCM10009839_64180 [Catenulispora yoronensis]|uniref:Uncharacterized protein n=1 Tax=Catenulispora yoronensis TaxID=450799 RepID=A0ABP5GNH5_9ACTN